jgi:hypothetical protein
MARDGWDEQFDAAESHIRQKHDRQRQESAARRDGERAASHGAYPQLQEAARYIVDKYRSGRVPGFWLGRRLWPVGYTSAVGNHNGEPLTWYTVLWSTSTGGLYSTHQSLHDGGYGIAVSPDFFAPRGLKRVRRATAPIGLTSEAMVAFGGHHAGNCKNGMFRRAHRESLRNQAAGILGVVALVGLLIFVLTF